MGKKEQLIKEIEQKKEKIDALLPLDPQKGKELWQKFRLEWNYNSNHIEGNTLTYGHTELLLRYKKTDGNYDIRELEEMKAHDVAIAKIREMAEEKERDITESEIRELNQIILVEPFYKKAKTPEGQITKRLITPGKYKDDPNHVELPDGSTFYFTEPVDVPFKMQELISWYQNENDLHPIEKAALFHYKFILIHPFDDGNGRIARLLLNYHLMKKGYPPIVIKSKSKKDYLSALNLADIGNLNAFVEYILNQMDWSQSLQLKAAQGKKIEENEDWQKELALIKQSGGKEPVFRNLNVAVERFNDSFLPLGRTLKDTIKENFGELFRQFNVSLTYGNNDISPFIINPDIKEIREDVVKRHVDKPNSIKCALTLIGYKKNDINAFDVQLIFDISLSDYYYLLKVHHKPDFKIMNGYDIPMTENEFKAVINLFGSEIVKYIKNKTAKS